MGNKGKRPELTKLLAKVRYIEIKTLFSNFHPNSWYILYGHVGVGMSEYMEAAADRTRQVGSRLTSQLRSFRDRLNKNGWAV